MRAFLGPLEPDEILDGPECTRDCGRVARLHRAVDENDRLHRAISDRIPGLALQVHHLGPRQRGGFPEGVQEGAVLWSRERAGCAS
ncbi:MAG TPA: hypothetical protein VF128_10400 [Gemmatimonadaceae bacterium]